MTTAVEAESAENAEGVENAAAASGKRRGPKSGHLGFWIFRRILLGFLALAVVSVLIFLATTMLPGDAAQAILGKSAKPQELAALREQLGLTRPPVEQYLSWLQGFFTGDLGTSLTSRQPVSSIVVPAAINSAVLIGLTLLVCVPLALAIGCYAAVHRNGRVDRVLLSASMIFSVIPEFVIGMVLVILFATVVFPILPAVALIPPDQLALNYADQLVLPVAALTLVTLPYLVLTIRSALCEALDSDYIVFARLKGLSERRIVYLHALSNTWAPLLQAVALTVAWLAGSLVIIEFLFNVPGLGSAMQKSVTTRDLPLIQSVTLVLAAVTIAANLLADVLTVLTTPRLRTGGRR
ncbi:ABC transporter permease subunit [Gordonia sp. SID5947]|uniref:ABC transporter permease n=1 Tax=Gordonia sp. SID5947 TaxID=2690315 RepID=UPI00136C2C90|nr:ABC transporter permease [Gordonia sp. SID5947]MYR07990.1 ABC transporter permease subunit [Gordonia sp. SID5947]